MDFILQQQARVDLPWQYDVIGLATIVLCVLLLSCWKGPENENLDH